jgi:hypothetical protein
MNHRWKIFTVGAVLFGCPAAPTQAPATEPPAETKKAPEPASDLALGDPLPSADVSMLGVDGESLTLGSAATDKGLLVLFTCNHCPWVKAWEARTVAAANAARELGIGVVAVNSNDPAAYPEDGMDGMKERSSRSGMTYPYVVDATSDVARSFGADKTPEVFLFDADRKLVYTGTIDDNAKQPDAVTKTYLQDAVDALAKGQPIGVPQTKSLGCSIKYRPGA